MHLRFFFSNNKRKKCKEKFPMNVAPRRSFSLVCVSERENKRRISAAISVKEDELL